MTTISLSATSEITQIKRGRPKTTSESKGSPLRRPPSGGTTTSWRWPIENIRKARCATLRHSEVVHRQGPSRNILGPLHPSRGAPHFPNAFELRCSHHPMTPNNLVDLLAPPTSRPRVAPNDRSETRGRMRVRRLDRRDIGRATHAPSPIILHCRQRRQITTGSQRQYIGVIATAIDAAVTLGAAGIPSVRTARSHGR
jgi:hypothetical protein